jgi:serine/threonine-protein kinase
VSDDPLVGCLLAGKFLVKRCIGRGGMGAVYEAENIAFGKRVAIKIIEPEFAASSEMAERFRNEARAASRIESEHIVQVFDTGEDPDRGLYMVMELLLGEDLASRLERETVLAPEIVTAIGVQTARTLAQAHEAGVVHRDLKPANLFLTTRSDGALHVKILDFGISKLQRAELGEAGGGGGKPGALTKVGTLLGTPQYMSPEQAQGLAVDALSDVWSLGAVLYEALAGRPAFADTQTNEQMIIQIVTRKPEPLSTVAPWVPGALAEVVHAALTLDLAARLPSAARFAQDLAAARSQGSAATSIEAPSASVPVRAVSAALAFQPTVGSAAAKPTIGATVIDAPARSAATRPVLITLLVALGLVGSALLVRAVGGRGSGVAAAPSSGLVLTAMATASSPPALEPAPRASVVEPVVTPGPSPTEPAASSSSRPSAPTSKPRPQPSPRNPPTNGVGHVKAYE